MEHVPVPLISVGANDRVTVWNNAARRLFGTARLTNLDDLEQFGGDLARRILTVRPGERTLASVRVDDVDQSLSISASEFSTAGDSERLVSLQNIQSELDVMQLTAWQDLVRVLTHEIMNSITPVSSLAKTAADLADDVSRKVAGDAELVAELVDVKDAVNTVARRSDGLMSFVSSYRQLTRAPAPEKSRIELTQLFDDVQRMVTADWPVSGPVLTTRVVPGGLDLVADRQQIEQVLINLLRNAEHAVSEVRDGRIELTAGLNHRGRVTIDVLDNGPGVPDDIASRIFVPFFTTRKAGSGVGLALSRQVMVAHGGSISFTNQPEGGVRFSLAF